ncbi:MAG: hypothetical protein HY303_01925 [Candidatus Wallbacteria bacterium]|nr:hypothetical protein [Candidatus Wallbacteria bacterium]
MPRLNKIAVRQVAIVVLISFLSSLAAPIAMAQDYGDGGAAAGRGEAQFSPQDDQEFAGDVAGRVALKQDLEKRWADAAARSQSARARLQQLQTAQPPAGADPNVWYAQRDKEVQRLQEYVISSDRNIGDFRRNLGNVYSQIDKDKQRLYSVRDDGLRQDLGTLLGVGGMAAIPLHARPSIGNLSGAIKRSYQGSQLNGIGGKISDAQARSAAMGEKLSNMQAPTKNTWSVVEENGRVYTKGVDGTLKDMGPATTKAADGTEIKNDSAFRKGEYYNELYGTKSAIQNQIDTLKFNRDRASTAKGKEALDQKITDLEGKKTQLEKDISEYDSSHPSAGGQLKNLAMGAAKWAAFGAGLTVASNAIQQLTANGWDPARIDWGAAIAPLKTAEFWGGTAGSFGVSMLASALIPGGAFVKTFTAIAGAAVGWQLGSGNLFHTDWTDLITGSVGATVGTLIGTALGGPIGAFIGGIVGQYAATWILGKVREWLEARSETTDPRSNGNYPNASDPPGYNRPQIDQSAVPGYRGSDPGELKARMDQAYMQMMQYSRDSSQMEKFDRSRREYMTLKAQLEQMQRSAQ